MSVVVTFIRHAEAVDTKSSWGSKQRPLSNQGINQAHALGKEFADTHFTAIYTSDLCRAFNTAKVLYDHQKDPRPSFDSSDLLRELDVGLAEGSSIFIECLSGRTWQDHAAMGIYPAWYSDSDRFPGGESIEDLAVRARTALDKFVFPHVWQAAKEGKTGTHVAIVSHGLCTSELISELLNWDGKHGRSTGSQYSNIPNAAWTRVSIDIEGAQEGQPMDVDEKRPVLAMRLTNPYFNDF